MKKWALFIVITALLLTPWPVAYAHSSVLAANDGIQVEAAAAEASPSWKAYGKAIGSVTPGDLFYINAENVTADRSATLLLTNAGELTRIYRYMTLKIGVYYETADGQWQKFNEVDGSTQPASYLTLQNGGVTLGLPAAATSKITVDSGCFYCYGVPKGETAAKPLLYLTIE